MGKIIWPPGVMVIEDVVTEDALRTLHLMSNSDIQVALPKEAQVKRWTEAGVFHLLATWLFFGILEFRCEGWPKPRRLLVWSLRPGERVSEAIEGAAEMFERAVGFTPKFAWVRSLPQGAEFAQDVHGCMLLEAPWMLKNAVAVGGRR